MRKWPYFAVATHSHMVSLFRKQIRNDALEEAAQTVNMHHQNKSTSCDIAAEIRALKSPDEVQK